MTMMVVASRFRLGATVITANAHERLNAEDVLKGLQRHAAGDWGELSAEDVAENERSLRSGYRVMSAYSDRQGTRFWIITEADRSVTTILLPEDY